MKLILTVFVLTTTVIAKATVTGAWRSYYKAPTQVYVITFDGAVNCSHLKIDVTKNGVRATSDATHSYVQMCEIEIINSAGVNVATSATFALTNNWNASSQWQLSHINDGVIDPNGTTTGQDQTGTFTITLSATADVNKIILYPRQDASADNNQVANFPASFTVQTSSNGTDYATQLSVTDLAPGMYSDERVYYPTLSEDDILEDNIIQIRDNGASTRYVGYKSNINNGTAIYGVAANSGRIVTFRMVNVGTHGSYKTFQLRGYGDAVYVARNYDEGNMLGWYNKSGGNGTYYLGCDFNDDATVYLYGDNIDGFTADNHYIRWWNNSTDNDCGIQANQASGDAQKYYLLRQIGSLYALDGSSSSVEADVITPYANSVENFCLTGRTFSSSNWNTLCLPFAMTAKQITATFGADCLIYECTTSEESGGTTTFTFVATTAITAGKAYLIKPAADVENPVFADVTITATTPTSASGNAFVGTFSPTDLATDGSQLFLGAENMLYKPASGKNTMNGFRAYFQLASAKVKAAILNFDNETRITETTEKTETKEGLFDLSGRKVVDGQWSMVNERLPKGLYIVNGRKVLVK